MFKKIGCRILSTRIQIFYTLSGQQLFSYPHIFRKGNIQTFHDSVI